jgi:hypothetical protein
MRFPKLTMGLQFGLQFTTVQHSLALDRSPTSVQRELIRTGAPELLIRPPRRVG